MLANEKLFSYFNNTVIKKNSVEELVFNILVLNHKLRNIDNQSIYFKMALQNKEEQYEKLKVKFEDYRVLINKTPLDTLLEEIAKSKIQIAKIKEWNGGRLIKEIALKSFEEKIFFFEMIMGAKAKYKHLLPIDDYIEEPEKCLSFFEI